MGLVVAHCFVVAEILKTGMCLLIMMSNIMQGEYEARYKLAEGWQPLLEMAERGELRDALRQHHLQQRTANGSFIGTLAPQLVDTAYR